MTDPGDAYGEELGPGVRPGEGYAPASAVTSIARRSPSQGPREAPHEAHLESWLPGPSAEATLADECERAQLIAGIARLIREPAMPESARLAALTLIGWLARRRPQEAAHAIGVEEARKSERQWRAARPKAR